MNLSKAESSRWDKFLIQIKEAFCDVTFLEARYSSFSYEKRTIFYKQKDTFLLSASSLLHEIGHLLSDHRKFDSDIELLKMEVEAWEKASTLAKKYLVKIDKNYIEDCLDSYRDWLHKRSSCPNCAQNGVQKNQSNYACINCGESWTVSKSRFCRTYRLKTKTLL